MHSVESFQQLLDAAKSGDHDAIAQIVQRYEPELRIVARVRLGNALRPYLDSVDLVQSVHRSLLISLRFSQWSVQSPEHLTRLALMMLRRKLARKWRHLKKQQRLSLPGVSDEELTKCLEGISDQYDDPQHLAARQERLGRLMSQLDDTDKVLIRLRIEGFTTADAAKQLNADAGVLRVRLSRLRRHLDRVGIAADWI